MRLVKVSEARYMARKTKVVLAFAGAAGMVLASASPAEAGRIADRKNNQQQRIAQGVASGQLTARETARLEGREAALNRSVARMRSNNGGTLTPGERFRVEQRQDRISRGIYLQKHDGQTP